MGAYELVVSEDATAGVAPTTIEDGYKPGQLPATDETPDGDPNGKKNKAEQRLVSLDVFRGFTVVLMILVDDVGGLIPALNHSPWDGVTLADFVMPFFLFIVGVALGLVYKKVPNRIIATRKALLRASKLFIFGLILQGGYFHGVNNLTYGVDLSSIRWMGILQRIAIAYFVAALCEIWLRSDCVVNEGIDLLKRYWLQLLVGIVLITTYLVLLYGIYVPDWEYQIISANSELRNILVKCGVKGDTGPGCNAAGWIDRKILGIRHLYKRPSYVRSKLCSVNSPQYGPLRSDAPSWCEAPFDPEGLLSSVTAVVTCLIGLQFGHIIVHFKSHKDRIINWMMPSFFFMAVAFALDFFGIYMNKGLYTVSYTFATAGAAGILFAGFYVLVDVYGCRQPTRAMEWIGKHALMIFILIGCNLLPVLIQGLYWKEQQNNLLHLVGLLS